MSCAKLRSILYRMSRAFNYGLCNAGLSKKICSLFNEYIMPTTTMRPAVRFTRRDGTVAHIGPTKKTHYSQAEIKKRWPTLFIGSAIARGAAQHAEQEGKNGRGKQTAVKRAMISMRRH